MGLWILKYDDIGYYLENSLTGEIIVLQKDDSKFESNYNRQKGTVCYSLTWIFSNIFFSVSKEIPIAPDNSKDVEDAFYNCFAGWIHILMIEEEYKFFYH